MGMSARKRKKPEALGAIRSRVLHDLGVDPAELGSSSRRPYVVLAREAIAYLGRKAGATWWEIAQQIGASSHASAVQAARRMEGRPMQGRTLRVGAQRVELSESTLGEWLARVELESRMQRV